MPASDPPLLTASDRRRAEKKPFTLWRWNASPGACERCQALDGLLFLYDEVPERPHPNCKCTVTVHGVASEEAAAGDMQARWQEQHTKRWEAFSSGAYVGEIIVDDEAGVLDDALREALFGETGAPVLDTEEGPLDDDIARAMSEPLLVQSETFARGGAAGEGDLGAADIQEIVARAQELQAKEEAEAAPVFPWDMSAPQGPMCEREDVDVETGMCLGEVAFSEDSAAAQEEDSVEAAANLGIGVASGKMEYVEEPEDNIVDTINEILERVEVTVSFSAPGIKLTTDFDENTDLFFQFGTLAGVTVDIKNLFDVNEPLPFAASWDLDKHRLRSANVDTDGGISLGLSYSTRLEVSVPADEPLEYVRGSAIEPSDNWYFHTVQRRMGYKE